MNEVTPPNIDHERALARYGGWIAARGWPHGSEIRRQMLQEIRRKRRAYWRALVAERIELGYRDLGGEG